MGGEQSCCAAPAENKDHHANGASADKAHGAGSAPAAEAKAAALVGDGVWMEKLGVINKSWKRRWFRLEETRLYYSESPTAKKCEGIIYMKSVTEVNGLGQTSSWDSGRGHNTPKWEYELEIVCDIKNHVKDTLQAPGWHQHAIGKNDKGVIYDHVRKFRLRTDDKKVYDAWVAKLQASAHGFATAKAAAKKPGAEEGVPPADEKAKQEAEDAVKMAKLAAAAEAHHVAQEEKLAAEKAHAQAERAAVEAAKAKADEKAAYEKRAADEAAAAKKAGEEAAAAEAARIAEHAAAEAKAIAEHDAAAKAHEEAVKKAAAAKLKREQDAAAAAAAATAAAALAAKEKQEADAAAALAAKKKADEEAAAAATA